MNKKVEGAMESMDIQVVDPANLPKEVSSPKPIKYLIIGAVIGFILSMAYILIMYFKTKNKKDWC